MHRHSLAQQLWFDSMIEGLKLDVRTLYNSQSRVAIPLSIPRAKNVEESVQKSRVQKSGVQKSTHLIARGDAPQLHLEECSLQKKREPIDSRPAQRHSSAERFPVTGSRLPRWASIHSSGIKSSAQFRVVRE